MYSASIRQFFNDKTKNTVYQYPKSVELLKEINNLGLKEEDLPERNVVYVRVTVNSTLRLFQNMGEYLDDESSMDIFNLVKYKPYFSDFKQAVLLDDFIEKIVTTPCYIEGESQRFLKFKKDITIQMKRKKKDHYPLVAFWKDESTVPEIYEFQLETDFDYLNRIKYINDLI
jgi:hypothetical protein